MLFFLRPINHHQTHMNNKKVLLKRREVLKRANQIKVFIFNYQQSSLNIGAKLVLYLSLKATLKAISDTKTVIKLSNKLLSFLQVQQTSTGFSIKTSRSFLYFTMVRSVSKLKMRWQAEIYHVLYSISRKPEAKRW